MSLVSPSVSRDAVSFGLEDELVTLPMAILESGVIRNRPSHGVWSQEVAGVTLRSTSQGAASRNSSVPLASWLVIA